MLRLTTILLLFVAPFIGAESAAALFLQAQQSLQQNDLPHALEAVQKGLSLAPESLEGLNILGIVLEQESHFEEAEAAFQRALQLSPASVRTHDNLGTSYLLRNQLDLAQKQFETSLRLKPNDPSACYQMGRLLLQKNQAAAAVKYLERAPRGDASAQVTFVDALLRSGQPKRALAIAQSISDAYRNEPRVHFSLGLELAALQQYAAATHEFEIANTLVPNTYEVLHNLGKAQLKGGNAVAAAAFLQQALTLQPSSAEDIVLLAQSQADQQKFPEAVELCARARNLEPQSPDALLLLGQIGMAEDLDTQAQNLLQAAVSLSPNRPDLHAALGECLLKLGNPAAAIEQFKTVLSLQPTADALALMGEAYAATGQSDLAAKYLNQALAKDPNNPAALYQSGLMASKQGDTHRAEILLAFAAKANPPYDNALYELAGIKMDRGNYAEAVPLLRRCAVTMKIPRVYYRLATAERHLNLTESATADMALYKVLSEKQSQGSVPIRDALTAIRGTTQVSPPR